MYFLEKQLFVFKLDITNLSNYFLIKGTAPLWNIKIDLYAALS